MLSRRRLRTNATSWSSTQPVIPSSSWVSTRRATTNGTTTNSATSSRTATRSTSNSMAPIEGATGTFALTGKGTIPASCGATSTFAQSTRLPCTIITTRRSPRSPQDEAYQVNIPARTALRKETQMRLTAAAVLLALMSGQTALAQLSADDVKWINQCIADNKGGANEEV